MPEGLEFELLRRRALAEWVDRAVARFGPTLDLAVLQQGFEFEGQRHPVMHMQKGIYKPRGSPFALTLKRSIRGTYPDRFTADGALRYQMERSGPDGADNRAVAESFRHGLPLLFLDQVSRGSRVRFTVFHPVWIVDIDRERREFGVDLERPATLSPGELPLTNLGISKDQVRRYAERHIRIRLHQARFRQSVLEAYAISCAMCRLREPALLDAAHIDPDASEDGEPVVNNGLALCRLHHAAFDACFIGIEPKTCRIHVQPRLLNEQDGPILRHGIQDLEGVELRKPKLAEHHPDRDRLERRWHQFELASV